jgi:hypothetical protein
MIEYTDHRKDYARKGVCNLLIESNIIDSLNAEYCKLQQLLALTQQSSVFHHEMVCFNLQRGLCLLLEPVTLYPTDPEWIKKAGPCAILGGCCLQTVINI